MISIYLGKCSDRRTFLCSECLLKALLGWVLLVHCEQECAVEVRLALEALTILQTDGFPPNLCDQTLHSDSMAMSLCLGK